MAQPRPQAARTWADHEASAAPRLVGRQDARPRHLHPSERVLLPLRAFLGVTFCFAGLQKLANPDFFRASSPVSIQSQLAGAAHHSPLHGLLASLGHVAVPLGVAIAFGELAVGLGTLFGLFSRVAAAGGMIISLGLFLTVSWHSNPYYTGSDIVFLFAWTPLLLAPPTALSADLVLAGVARHAMRLPPDAPAGGRAGAELDRRTFALKGMLAGVLAAVGVVGGSLAAGLGRLFGGPSAPSSTLSAGAGPARSATTTTNPAGPSSPPTTAVPRPPGTRLGPASSVPVGGAASFTDPGSGDPALVVQPERGTFLAFDAVCPHAGCPVQFSSHDATFVCPCHGSVFNARTGDVEVGPAQSGLTRIPVAEGSDGQLYAR